MPTALHTDHTSRTPYIAPLEPVSVPTSAWDSVAEGEPDAILAINDVFRQDCHPNKLNLGVGAYRDEAGQPVVFTAVRRAEAQLVNDIQPDKEYSAASGNAELCQLSAELLFGSSSNVLHDGRNATVQTISGTGALRLAAELLRQFLPHRPLLLPTPSWALHRPLFMSCGIKVMPYRYYAPGTRSLDAEGMLTDLRTAPAGALVLLHACAHNPTGVDPMQQQWADILAVVRERRLLPFFDIAYQGFASGCLEQDAWALRLFADAGLEMLVAQSYAKNMGLYGERVGTLTVVCNTREAAGRVHGQLKQICRSLYSNPPRHGAEVAVLVLKQPQLRQLWQEQLTAMCQRLRAVRQLLYEELLMLGVPGDWSHIIAQNGMFSYTGLTPAQVGYLRDCWHVYMTNDGRMAVCSLRASQCQYLAKAIHDTVINVPIWQE